MQRINHSVFDMHYHLVLVVKYRRKVLDDAISQLGLTPGKWTRRGLAMLL